MRLYELTLPIPNTENAIVRPIIYGVIKDLMCEGILPKIKRVTYNEAITGRIPNGKSVCNTAARMKCEEYISISGTPEYMVDDDQWVRSWSKHRKPLWRDEKHKLSITPLYDIIKHKLEIVFTTTSLSKLRIWRDTVRISQRRGRQFVFHTIDYAIPFSRGTYEWWCDMYNLSKDDYSSLKNFIKFPASNALDWISSGTHLEMVTSEQVINVRGTVEQTTPIITKHNDGRYVGRLTYIVEYNKPLAYLHQYPIMVNQHVVPNKYIPIPNAIPNWYWTAEPLAAMEYLDLAAKHGNETIHVPNFDRNNITTYPPYYRPVFTVLVEIDPQLPLELFNLKQLGGVSVDRDILDVISKYYLEEITQHRRCPFLLTIHNGDSPMHYDYLTVDSDLNVELTRPVDHDGIYRVTFNILTNTSTLPPSALVGIATNTKALHQYVLAVNSMETVGKNKFGTDSHGINRTVLDTDFISGHYLKHYSPLVLVNKIDSDDPWCYKPISVFERGTSGNHVHTNTVQSTSSTAGSSVDFSTGKRINIDGDTRYREYEPLPTSIDKKVKRPKQD